jgi:anti-sigma B factor antagonist
MPLSPLEQLDIPEMEIMELSGRLDGDTSISIEEDVLLCIQSGAREMLMDCSKLDYITGAGMQTFLRLAREMQSLGGKFAVCNLQRQVKDMFEACGLESVIPVYEDQAAAKIAMAA